MWMMGKVPAHMTAKSVMASAARLMEVRQRWRKRKRMAEISVPAWPMPTQNTKFVMSKAHPTVRLRPQVPMPRVRVCTTAQAPRESMERVTARASHQRRGGRRSVGAKTSSVTWR